MLGLGLGLNRHRLLNTRPPIFSKLIQWACGDPTTLDDGTVIIEDKKGKSGLRAGREQIPSAYLEGDGIIDVFRDLDFYTTATSVTFSCSIRPQAVDFYSLIGLTTSANAIRFGLKLRNDGNIGVRNATALITPGATYSAGQDLDISVTYAEDGEGTLTVNGTDYPFDFATPMNIQEIEKLFLLSETTTETFEGRMYKVNLGDQLEYNFQDSNTNTYCYDASGNDNHGEIQNATGADRVESDNIAIGDMDSNGYTESDGVSYYRDQAATDLVLAGERSPNVNGFSVWYDSNGDRAVSQFTGLLKADLRVVDGVVDNGVDYGNWTSSGNVVIESNQITLQGDGATTQTAMISTGITENAKDYVVVINVNQAVTSGTFGLGSGGINDAFTFFDSTTTGEQRRVITTDNPISNDELQFLVNSTVSEDLTFQHIGTYDASIFTDPLTDPLPTSGTTEVGNSVIQATNRYDLIQADDLTTTDMYDTTDVDNAEALVVPITGNVVDNPLFISEDPFCWLLYDEVLTDVFPTDEYTKVLVFQKLVTALIDSEGEPLFDELGSRLYALNDGVEVI